VLEGGVLSYYHKESDYPSSCRGSISTLSVNVYFPDSNSDPSRFDIVGQGNIKYYLKARSPADAKRWVWYLMESRGWMAEDKGKRPKNNSERRDSFASYLDNDLAQIADNVANTETNGVAPLPDDDLFSYLDKYASGDFQTPELKRLLNLLKTEMQVQKETVQTALGMVEQVFMETREKSGPAIKNLMHLPKLLNDSSLHIETLIFGIVRHCNKREHIWENKLKKTSEAHRRLEAIMEKISIKEPELSENLIEPALLPELSIPNAENSSSDDEFFDVAENSPSNSDTRFSFARSQQDAYEQMSVISKTFLDQNDLEISKNGYQDIGIGRFELPIDPNNPMPSLAIWSFLKSAIGKDLTKIALPVVFNEPLSMLQRLCEDVEYIELLSLAARIGCKGNSPSKSFKNDPAMELSKKLELDYDTIENLVDEDASLLRLMFVGAFAMSNYASTADRTSKPFNPLLVFRLFMLG
jgi:hypothetical protein